MWMSRYNKSKTVLFGIARIRLGLLSEGWLNRCSKRDEVSTAICSEVFSLAKALVCVYMFEMFLAGEAEGTS